jgi:hypothetical protein
MSVQKGTSSKENDKMKGVLAIRVNGEFVYLNEKEIEKLIKVCSENGENYG